MEKTHGGVALQEINEAGLETNMLRFTYTALQYGVCDECLTGSC
jgi:hypothetical protein